MDGKFSKMEIFNFLHQPATLHEHKYEIRLIYDSRSQSIILIPFLTKAEFAQEGIFFLLHLFARDVLAMKKLKIDKTKPNFII